MTRPHERQRPLAGGRETSLSNFGDRKSSRLGGWKSTDPRGDFLDAMRDAGIVPTDPGAIVADGTLHRFDVDGDKPGRRNGWSVLHLDTSGAHGAFGSWRTGVTGTWRSGHGKVNTADRQRIMAAVQAARQTREAETVQRHAAAQARAQRMWDRAPEADPAHSYLVRKRVAPHGIRQVGDVLLVPMYDAGGVLWNVQTIDPEGNKRFLTGGRKRGLMFAIGAAIVSEIYITEGFATGATVFEASGVPTVVAFDCGNLEPVARALRAKYPTVRITFCADNDIATPGNPGLTKAREAARAVGGAVAVPPEPYNDFNDVVCAAAVAP